MCLFFNGFLMFCWCNRLADDAASEQLKILLRVMNQAAVRTADNEADRIKATAFKPHHRVLGPFLSQKLVFGPSMFVKKYWPKEIKAPLEEVKTNHSCILSVTSVLFSSVSADNFFFTIAQNVLAGFHENLLDNLIWIKGWIQNFNSRRVIPPTERHSTLDSQLLVLFSIYFIIYWLVWWIMCNTMTSPV